MKSQVDAAIIDIHSSGRHRHIFRRLRRHASLLAQVLQNRLPPRDNYDILAYRHAQFLVEAVLLHMLFEFRVAAL